MAVYTNASTEWSAAITLSVDSTIQVKNGAIAVTAEASPAALDGIELKHQFHSEGFKLPAGDYRYKLALGVTSAVFVIEAIA